MQRFSDLAAQNPDIVIAQQGDQVPNLIGYQIRNYEGMFLAGYACALMDGGDKLGFAGSMSGGFRSFRNQRLCTWCKNMPIQM